ncbi:MAG: rRNA maturation RNase YbeY [Anaerolineae bacterium]|nr:rRNA maturation RNase YbeY [Anaerolineae bacterium]
MDKAFTEDYWIDVQVDGDWPVDVELMHKTALATLVHQESPAVEVAVVISGDEALHDLNLRYRGVDAPTDVLAFANETRGPFVGASGQPHYLGDIIISYPRAAAQATEAGHAALAELQLLVVHGMLHLLGYDDQDDVARAEMWGVQEAILDALDVEITLPE